jgi:glycosyltransferase involved in cell wall biosynthesis
MQKTSFPFEVLIHDDASTDGTAEIIQEYQAKYPEIIKPILRKENLYSQGVRGINRFNFERVQGKYIALCEGDDFWTDPKKLQIQFDFMESHPEYSLCMHGRYVLNYIAKQYVCQKIRNNFPSEEKEFARQLMMGKQLHLTQTMFFKTADYRTKESDIWRDTKDAPMADTQIAFHLALAGKVKLLKKYMATYRFAPGSITCPGDKFKREDFIKQARIAMKKMADNNGCEDWWSEFERQLNSPAKMVKPPVSYRLLSPIYHAVKTPYGRIMFRKYLKSSVNKRIRLRLWIH